MSAESSPAPGPWQPDWDVYPTQIDDARAIIALDLAARNVAPLATHPQCLLARVKMLTPRPDGLRSNEESEALFQLEDMLAKRIAPLGGLQVGRFLNKGYSTFVFYLPDTVSDDDLHRAISRTPMYGVEISRKPDPEWSTYLEWLWPNPYAMQSIQNRRLLAARAEHGDRPEVVREIDHFAIFEDEAKARGAAEALRALGYRVDEPSCDDRHGHFGLQFHRDDRLDGHRADEFTYEILDAIEPFEGMYDGWGAVIEK